MELIEHNKLHSPRAHGFASLCVYFFTTMKVFTF